MARVTVRQLQSEVERLRIECARLEALVPRPRQQQLPLLAPAYLAARDKVRDFFAEHPGRTSVTKQELLAWRG